MFLILLFWTYATSVTTFAADKEEIKLADKISTLFETQMRRHKFNKDEMGAVIARVDMPKAKTVYELNGSQLRVPASLSKVVTAVGVLETLGVTWKTQTQLLSNANIDGKTLKGNLVLKGGGDPGFVSESMWFLVNEFVRTGVETIEGDIIVDASRFDNIHIDESRDDKRVDRAYDAPVSAMSFNWNSVNVYVRPTKNGEKPTVWVDPENTLFKVENKAVTGSGNPAIYVERVGNIIRVSGKISTSMGEKVFYKNIGDVTAWSGNNLIQFLKQRGITVKGQVKSGTAPKDATILAKADSKPLGEMVKDMMKFSNNFVAEMLVKNVAAEKKGMGASLAQGVDVIKQCFLRWDMPKSCVYLNPSGLSHENKFSPQDLINVLNIAAENMEYSSEFIASMPIAGLDGTLKNRMKNTPAQGEVRAKTGLLNGTSGLGGYHRSKSGVLYAFVLIFNGPDSKNDRARDFFDDLTVGMVKNLP